MPNLILSQFDSYDGSSGAPEFSVDPFTPIAGSASFTYLYPNVSGNHRRLRVPSAGSGVPKGLLRARFSWTVQQSVANASTYYGVTFAQSADNVMVTATTAYSVAMFRSQTDTIANRVQLVKHTNGITSALSGTLLDSASFTSVTTAVTMRVVWDLTGATGLFEVFTGTALDYSGMTSLFDYVDSSSPLLSSVAEGFFCKEPAGGGLTVHAVRFDNLLLEELV